MAMNTWKASASRITLFPAASVSSPPLSAFDLYRRVWGVDPDGFQKQPNPLLPSLAQGKHGGMMATCLTHSTRVDFNLTPTAPPQAMAQQPSVNLIEDGSRLHAELRRIIGAIGQGVVSDLVIRVGLNFQFLAVKPSSAEANSALTTTIPDQYGVRITDEEDFIFQINRPYTSRAVASIKMNSITKWSVDRLLVFTATIPMSWAPTSALATAGPATPQAAAFIAASVVFDNNNVPTETQLSRNQQSSLLREALTAAVQMQQDIGLNVEGFENAKLSH
jgi:hypothetical protein